MSNSANATDLDAGEPAESDGKLVGVDLIRDAGLFAILKEDWNTHYRQISAPGFWALAIYRFGNWSSTLPRPFKWLGTIVYVIAQRTIRNLCGIELERSVKVGRRLLLGHQHGIVIHRHATIGDDVLIRHGVTFGRGVSWTHEEGPVIGDRVEFSPGAVVIGNVTIGDDVSVGPNCVITQNVPPGRSLFVPPPRSLPKKEFVEETGSKTSPADNGTETDRA